MIRVLIAVDQRVSREVISAALSREEGIRVVSTVPDGVSGVTYAADLRPDVIVTSDIGAPAVQVVAEFQAVCPEAKIVLLLLEGRAMDWPDHAGADALVQASDGVDELIAAVRSVAR